MLQHCVLEIVVNNNMEANHAIVLIIVGDWRAVLRVRVLRVAWCFTTCFLQPTPPFKRRGSPDSRNSLVAPRGPADLISMCGFAFPSVDDNAVFK